MKRAILIISLVTLLLLSACAIGKRRISDEALLKTELKKWDSFQGSGIVEISAMGLALRKPFVLAKNQAEIRMDLIEGGVLGASPAPLLSIYLGEYAAIKAPIMPVLENIDLSGLIPSGGLTQHANSEGIYARYKDEIIQNKSIQNEEMKVSFDKSYRIDSVVDSRSNTTLKASYTPKGSIDVLTVTRGKSLSLRFVFDQVEYLSPSIVALPKPVTPGTDIMKALESNPMFQMFKGMIGD